MTFSGIVAVAALTTLAVGHTAEQATSTTVTTTVSQSGAMPQILGEFPGLQGGPSKPIEIGTGLILGRVVDGVETSGVGGAIVTLSLAGYTPVRVQADSEGRFAFRSLPKGTYSISTSRPGYVDGAASHSPTNNVWATSTSRCGGTPPSPAWCLMKTTSRLSARRCACCAATTSPAVVVSR
jgi:hypothetical protein